MRNQAQVFLGLFLIAFVLYASQLKKKARLVESKPSMPLIQGTPEPLPQTRIQVLYEKVVSEKIFSNRIDGVRISPLSALDVKNDFMVTLSGSEIFAKEGFSIHESWESTLDFLAELIKTEPGLKVEISGYADEDNPQERKPSDYGSSALAFSFARAEWLAHYYERKHGITISKSLVLKGMGAVPQGKKIEMRFYYPSQ